MYDTLWSFLQGSMQKTYSYRNSLFVYIFRKMVVLVIVRYDGLMRSCILTPEKAFTILVSQILYSTVGTDTLNKTAAREQCLAGSHIIRQE